MLVAGVGSDVGQPRSLVALGHDNDGVVHRALIAQNCHGLGHSGRALANGAIDANDVLAALIEDGVNGDRGLACLAVAKNQFTLAAADGNERVDDLQTGLQRHGDWRPVHDLRSRSLDGQAVIRNQGSMAIKRQAKRIDDATSNPSPTTTSITRPVRVDFVARTQMCVVP